MTWLALTEPHYRWLDRASKLLGVFLFAVGLDTGLDTIAGLVFGLCGIGLAVWTVFIIHQ